MSMFQFNGTNVADDIILRNGGGVGEIQSIGGGRLMLNGVDQVAINPLDGADKVTVKDLGGTGILDVSINLAGVLGESAPDGQVDQIVIEGTQATDIVNIVFSGNRPLSLA